MGKRNFQRVIEAILKDDKRYAVGAYVFVRMALDYTVKDIDKIRQSLKDDGQHTGLHVSGRELLEGIKMFGLETFGQMMSVLLKDWGVKNTADFGEIVFNLVKVGEMSKSDDDKLDDFKDVYDFYDVFERPFLPKSKGGI